VVLTRHIINPVLSLLLLLDTAHNQDDEKDDNPEQSKPKIK